MPSMSVQDHNKPARKRVVMPLARAAKQHGGIDSERSRLRSDSTDYGRPLHQETAGKRLRPYRRSRLTWRPKEREREALSFREPAPEQSGTVCEG